MSSKKRTSLGEEEGLEPCHRILRAEEKEALGGLNNRLTPVLAQIIKQESIHKHITQELATKDALHAVEREQTAKAHATTLKDANMALDVANNEKSQLVSFDSRCLLVYLTAQPYPRRVTCWNLKKEAGLWSLPTRL